MVNSEFPNLIHHSLLIIHHSPFYHLIFTILGHFKG
jgi:hypothetical protein